MYNTKYSQAVTHPSTNFAQPDLTSVIRREPVFSWWYGRRRKILDAAHFLPQIFNFQFFPNRFYAEKEGKVYNTKYSLAVTHPSTNFAQPDLTLVIRREPVFSWWYGRRRKILEAAYFLPTNL